MDNFDAVALRVPPLGCVLVLLSYSKSPQLRLRRDIAGGFCLEVWCQALRACRHYPGVPCRGAY